LSDERSVAGIPVVALPAALTAKDPVVVFIHGMSTTTQTLRDAFPEADDGLSRLYWRLPVLREGREAVQARRDDDPFRSLFLPVVEEGRAELARLVEALRPRPVALLGFSIGGLISLWGGADRPEVRGAVSIGGVPSLEYLLDFYPDYAWQRPDAVVARAAMNLERTPERLDPVPTLILHGLADPVAAWARMEPLARRLLAGDAARHPYHTFDNVQHRLAGEAPAERAELETLRSTASAWLRERLAPPR